MDEDRDCALCWARCTAAVFAFGAAIDATLVGLAAVHQPLGVAANIIFFPRLQRGMLLYVVALGATGTLSLVAAIANHRSLLLLVAALVAALAFSSPILAYVVYSITTHFGVSLQQQCPLVLERGSGTSDTIALWIMGFNSYPLHLSLVKEDALKL